MLKDRVCFARHLAGMLNRVGSATTGLTGSAGPQQRTVQPGSAPADSALAGVLPASIATNEELEVGLQGCCCCARERCSSSAG